VYNDKRYLRNEYRFEYFGAVSEQASLYVGTCYRFDLVDQVEAVDPFNSVREHHVIRLRSETTRIDPLIFDCVSVCVSVISTMVCTEVA
jgi:hypothetical protein